MTLNLGKGLILNLGKRIDFYNDRSLVVIVNMKRLSLKTRNQIKHTVFGPIADRIHNGLNRAIRERK